jgi:hypothetical protein
MKEIPSVEFALNILKVKPDAKNNQDIEEEEKVFSYGASAE